MTKKPKDMEGYWETNEGKKKKKRILDRVFPLFEDVDLLECQKTLDRLEEDGLLSKPFPINQKPKEDIHQKLRPFFEKAKEKGWQVGEHLFKYLTEQEMHQYDTIKSQLDYAKALEDVEDCIQISKMLLSESDFQGSGIEYSYTGKLIPVEQVGVIIKELKKRGGL